MVPGGGASCRYRHGCEDRPGGRLPEILQTVLDVADTACEQIVGGHADRHTLMVCGRRFGFQGTNQRLQSVGSTGLGTYGRTMVFFQSKSEKFTGWSDQPHRWKTDVDYTDNVRFGPADDRTQPPQPPFCRMPRLGTWRWKGGHEQMYVPSWDFLPLAVLVEAQDVGRITKGLYQALLEVNTFGRRCESRVVR